MEIKGKVIQVFPPVSGTSQSGKAWQKQMFIIETLDERYPKKIHFESFDTNLQVQAGQIVTVKFDLGSREYQGKWYYDVRVWSVVPDAPAQPQYGQPMQPQYGQPQGYAPQPAYAPQPQGYYQPQQGYAQPQSPDVPF